MAGEIDADKYADYIVEVLNKIIRTELDERGNPWFRYEYSVCFLVLGRC